MRNDLYVRTAQALKRVYAAALYLFVDRYLMSFVHAEMLAFLNDEGLFGEAAFHAHQMLVGFDRLFGRFDATYDVNLAGFAYS